MYKFAIADITFQGHSMSPNYNNYNVVRFVVW